MNRLFHRANILILRQKHRNFLYVLIAVFSLLLAGRVYLRLSIPGEAYSGILTCELEEHVHNESCFDEEGNIICGLEEHIHNEECYEEVMKQEEEVSRFFHEDTAFK